MILTGPLSRKNSLELIQLPGINILPHLWNIIEKYLSVNNCAFFIPATKPVNSDGSCDEGYILSASQTKCCK